MGYPLPVIVQGDSRRLREHVARADCVISSPPYSALGVKIKGHGIKGAGVSSGRNYGKAEYGATPGQLGTTSGDTFWTAARDIVAECYAILRPGGVCVWVTKAFVRKGKIVDFPGDWRRLCEHAGFVMEREAHAMLVKEQRGGHLFEPEYRKVTKRVSFFRRLAEAKGSPAIDYEVVQFMRRPEALSN